MSLLIKCCYCNIIAVGNAALVSHLEESRGCLRNLLAECGVLARFETISELTPRTKRNMITDAIITLHTRKTKKEKNCEFCHSSITADAVPVHYAGVCFEPFLENISSVWATTLGDGIPVFWCLCYGCTFSTKKRDFFKTHLRNHNKQNLVLSYLQKNKQQRGLDEFFGGRV